MIYIGVFIVQVACFLLAYEGEKQQHHGTLLRFAVVATLGMWVGDLLGCKRFIDSRQAVDVDKQGESTR